MKPKAKKHRLGIGALVAAAVALGWLLYLPVGLNFIELSYDLPFSWRSPIQPREVMIVSLDDEAHHALNQPYSAPWDRRLHADLLGRLKQGGARTVLFDIVFDFETGADPAFAEAIRAHGQVVLASLATQDSVTKEPKIHDPAPMLARAAAGIGLAEVQQDRDWTLLLLIPGGTANGKFYPTLTWKAAELAGVSVTKDPGSRLKPRWVNYYGPPGQIVSVGYHVALTNNPAMFRDKVVLVGLREKIGYTGRAKDTLKSPYVSGDPHYTGIEVHATIMANLLREEWLRRLPPLAELLLLGIIGAGFGYGLTRLRPLASLWAASGAIVLIIVVSFTLACSWHSRLWFPWLIPVMQVICAAVGAIAYNSIRSYVEKTLLKRSLELHLPTRRVEQILRRPELLEPSAEKQEVSLLFTDIADWSTISERVTPNRLFKLLNKYFGETIPCIHQTEGMVLQLIGDAIFAIWNAPEPQPNHQELACRAALLLRNKLLSFESSNVQYPLRTRAGLHCGLASVGNSGSAERFVYTALGAETNMASRLEGLNKYLHTEMLASDRIVEAVEDKFAWRNVGRFRLKGGDRVMDVYELVGDRGQLEATAPWRNLFAAGLRHFHNADFEKAATSFTQTLAIKPNDGPAEFYLKEIGRLRNCPPVEKWFGEINMEEK